MKHIIKHSEPQEFSAWKAQYPAAKFKDLSDERSFPGASDAKRSLRKSLKEEQLGLCCYCESRLIGDDFHIEHFKPKDPNQFPQLQLEYHNLHACCRAVAMGGPDECCGHKKKGDYTPDLISPLEPDCSSHFTYTLAGGIDGDGRGKTTIEMLNLDSGLLRARRKALISYFESLEDDDYESEVQYHLSIQSDNTTGEFYTTIEYLHNKGLLR